MPNSELWLQKVSSLKADLAFHIKKADFPVIYLQFLHHFTENTAILNDYRLLLITPNYQVAT